MFPFTSYCVELEWLEIDLFPAFKPHLFYYSSRQSLAWIDSNLSTPQKISETIALHKDRLGPDPTSMTIAQLKTFFKKDVAE
jgi:hypothetical protein